MKRVYRFKDFIINEKDNFKLTTEEEKIVKIILTDLENNNEKINWKNINKKLIDYSRKGLITISIVIALLSSPIFANQSDADNLVQTINIENVITNDSTYTVYGIGISPSRSIAKKKSISDANKNLSDELDAKKISIKSYKVVDEEILTKDGYFVFFVKLEINKNDVKIISNYK